MSAVELINARLSEEESFGTMAVPDVRISRREFHAALAEAWEEGAVKGDSVGMTAITLNPMHGNPYTEEP